MKEVWVLYIQIHDCQNILGLYKSEEEAKKVKESGNHKTAQIKRWCPEVEKIWNILQEGE